MRTARVCAAQLSLYERPVAHECLERSNGHALGVCVAAHSIAQQMPQCLGHVVRARGGLGEKFSEVSAPVNLLYKVTVKGLFGIFALNSLQRRSSSSSAVSCRDTFSKVISPVYFLSKSISQYVEDF